MPLQAKTPLVLLPSDSLEGWSLGCLLATKARAVLTNRVTPNVTWDCHLDKEGTKHDVEKPSEKVFGVQYRYRICQRVANP